MSATLLSAILGFVREVVNARYFGASWQMDAFLAAYTIPTILFGVFNGALVTALVPIFTDYVSTDREDEACRLASTLLIGLTVLLTAAAVLGAVLAPWYVPLMARFPPAHVHVAVTMARWLMPVIIFTCLAGMIAALLSAYHRFGAAALQGVVANLIVVTAVVAYFGRFGIFALVYGSLAGVVAQVLVQLPALVALRRLRLRFDWQHPGLRKLLVVLGPIALGSAAGQLALFFDRYFASGLGVGSIAGMNYATKLVGFPQQIFVTAIATVVFPVFASQYANRNRVAMRRSIATALKMVIFLTVPSAVGLCMLAGPLVQTLFERGAFTGETTVLCASLLPFAAVGLVALAGNVILTRCLFAGGVVNGAIAIAVGTVAANVVLSLLFLPSLGVRGLLLANAVSQSAQTFALAILVWRLLDGFEWRGVVRSFATVALCAAIMGVALSAVQVFRGPPGPNEGARIASLVEHLVLGALVYVGLARLFDSAELELAFNLLLRRGTPKGELTAL